MMRLYKDLYNLFTTASVIACILISFSDDGLCGFPPMQVTAKANTSAQMLYVSKDVGKDTNDCSIFRPCKTIGVAVTAANLLAAYYKQVIVNIQPSNTSSGYNENVTLSQQGVNLMCVMPFQNARPCIVGGTLTVNLTGTSGTGFVAASNEVYVMGLSFSAGASTALTFSGTVFQKLVLVNSYIQSGAATAVSQTNTGVNGSLTSEVTSYDTTFENNSSTLPTVTLTAGRFTLKGTTPTVQNLNAAGPSFLQNGPSAMIANVTQFVGQYQLTDNTATASFNLSSITSGSTSGGCIVTPGSPSTGYALLSYFGCSSSATNSITGSGLVVNSPANVRFSTSGDIIPSVTQTVLGPGFPQGEVMIGAGSVTGTNVLLSIKGGHVKAAQATAPTAVVNANAGTGATCSLTNGTDVGGKISLTTTATAPASGVQCTVTFNKAYGVAPICTFSANNNNSTLFAVANGVFFTTTTTTLVVNYANSDTLGHANTWMYNCLETQ